MIYRTLGSTGEKVSAIGVGGWHLGLKRVDEQLAIRIVRSAIDRGINFLDNCWDYNDGASELRMGKALRDGYRARSFVMTKIDGRSKKEAAKQLDESLRRLGVDYIDLVQHHEIIRFEDPHRVFDDQGANAATVDHCARRLRSPINKQKFRSMRDGQSSRSFIPTASSLPTRQPLQLIVMLLPNVRRRRRRGQRE